ncbi:MAG: hypothetical protein KAS32_14370, partial [Candidatus Peribacteraceae bacterium]|nr:hypothetical protein [Candidatus Peribacteraceae bacterium]
IHLCDAEYGKIYYYRRRMNECYFVKLHSVHKNGRNRDEYEMTVYKFLCGNEKTQENKERVDILLSMFYNGMLIEDLVAFQKL